MPDISTLKSAIEIDIFLRAIFQNNESAILTNVLGGTIHPRLIPEVVAILDSSPPRMGSWSKDKVYRLLERYFRREPASIKWKLQDALIISDIYEHVHFFVDGFTSSALSAHPKLPSSPLSPNERCRIEGAFLRLQLFCNIFREDLEESQDIFFNNFSYWENEQLACINDYLESQLRIPFEDVADHDVFWGKMKVTTCQELDLDGKCYLQALIANGLGYIHQLVTASTYEERREILGLFPSSARYFLTYTLTDAGDIADCVLSEFYEQQKKGLASKSSLEDPDSGPYNAWYWAHAHDDGEDFVFGPDYYGLRYSGYVMWDNWRLSEWNIFSETFQYRNYHYLPASQSSAHPWEIRKSWKRRTEIYKLGGRGWWSKDDESKIVWPEKNGT
ncbi:hypothetical protein FQN54_001257 [Arachnomyces sp. PD_36]|nr:hypothetical protein FQN54_001257 [Arachnomyces sp. PD_36]